MKLWLFLIFISMWVFLEMDCKVLCDWFMWCLKKELFIVIIFGKCCVYDWVKKVMVDVNKC